MKLKCVDPLSNFAFIINVRRYTTDLEQARAMTDEDISEDLGQARDALKRALEADIKAGGLLSTGTRPTLNLLLLRASV